MTPPSVIHCQPGWWKEVMMPVVTLSTYVGHKVRLVPSPGDIWRQRIPASFTPVRLPSDLKSLNSSRSCHVSVNWTLYNDVLSDCKIFLYHWYSPDISIKLSPVCWRLSYLVHLTLDCPTVLEQKLAHFSFQPREISPHGIYLESSTGRVSYLYTTDEISPLHGEWNM